MSALSIALKDLQILFKDRGALVYLFLVPLLLIIVFGSVLGAVGQGDEDARIPLPVVDLDGGEAARTLLDGLDAAGGIRVEAYDQAEALALLDENEIDRVLVIPTGLDSGITGGQAVALRLTNHPDADPQETEAVRLVVEGVARDMTLQGQILASLQQMGDMLASAPQEYRQAFAVERTQAQAQSQFERAQTQPLVAVIQTVPAQDGEREEMPSIAITIIPGLAVLFIFLTAQNTAQSIHDEKKVGSFRRLLAAPMKKATLLSGKMLPTFFTGLIQAAVIFAFGAFGLSLIGLTAVSLGNDPLAFVLVVALIALCSSAFGILIAALARTENQIGGFSTFLLWGMGLLGGSIIPVFIMDNFGIFPKLVPQYWANRALDKVLIRGLGLTDLTTEMAVLLAFTAFFFAVGLWRFDFD